MEADIIISLTHFKGHELTGFGGALKNIGMGKRLPRRKLFLFRAKEMQDPQRSLRIQCKSSRSSGDKELVGLFFRGRLRPFALRVPAPSST